MQAACTARISGMQICAMPRQHTDNVVKGEGIHLVGLGEVFLCRKVLKVDQHMEAANVLSAQRNDVVKVCAGWSIHEELRNGPSVCP